MGIKEDITLAVSLKDKNVLKIDEYIKEISSLLPYSIKVDKEDWQVTKIAKEQVNKVDVIVLTVRMPFLPREFFEATIRIINPPLTVSDGETVEVRKAFETCLPDWLRAARIKK